MIKYNLKCKNKHEFESWFSDSKEFEKLKKKGLVECIFCKSNLIEKSIMSPRVLSKDEKDKTEKPLKHFNKVKKELLKIQKFVEKNFKYVGKDFSREVRKVYYDKKGDKNIYGQVTAKEEEELRDEGIEISSIPWVDKKEN